MATLGLWQNEAASEVVAALPYWHSTSRLASEEERHVTILVKAKLYKYLMNSI